MENPHEFQEQAALAPVEEKEEKSPYETPALIVHGKVEKLTLQTVVIPP